MQQQLQCHRAYSFPNMIIYMNFCDYGKKLHENWFSQLMLNHMNVNIMKFGTDWKSWKWKRAEKFHSRVRTQLLQFTSKFVLVIASMQTLNIWNGDTQRYGWWYSYGTLYSRWLCQHSFNCFCDENTLKLSFDKSSSSEPFHTLNHTNAWDLQTSYV